MHQEPERRDKKCYLTIQAEMPADLMLVSKTVM